MTHTDQLRRLQGSAYSDTPAAGRPTTIWPADVTAINQDGTVNLQPVNGRAGKVSVPVPVGYSPTVGDRVLVANMLGEPQYPVVIAELTTTPPAVTGSRSTEAAFNSLLAALVQLGLIVNDTTT